MLLWAFSEAAAYYACHAHMKMYKEIRPLVARPKYFAALTAQSKIGILRRSNPDTTIAFAGENLVNLG